MVAYTRMYSYSYTFYPAIGYQGLNDQIIHHTNPTSYEGILWPNCIVFPSMPYGMFAGSPLNAYAPHRVYLS